MAIGIDFGGTVGSVGVWNSKRQKIEVVALESGSRTFPIVVSFDGSETFLAGDARARAIKNPKGTFFDTKHLLGKSHHDAVIYSEKNNRTYKVVQCDEKFAIKFQNKGESREFSPDDILTMIFQKMKTSAEAFLKMKISDCVVSVPVWFSSAQRMAVRSAVERAGMTPLSLVNEPTVACVAYGIDVEDSIGQQNIVVFDFGGTSCDVAVISAHGGLFQIVSSLSNNEITAMDIIDEMVKFFSSQFERNHGIDISKDLKAKEKLRLHCERTLIVLSKSASASVAIDSLCEGIDFHSRITRARFEQLCLGIFGNAVKCIQACIDQAQIAKTQINKVLIIGGLANIPKVQECVRNFFSDSPSTQILERPDLPPDEVITHGVTMQAALLSGNMHGEEVPKATDIEDKIKITQLSLGVRIDDDQQDMHVLIPKGTVIPIQVTQTFDCNQKQTSIQLYEGEHKNADGNILLGSFSTELKSDCNQVTVTLSVEIDGKIRLCTNSDELPMEIGVSDKLCQQQIDQLNFVEHVDVDTTEVLPSDETAEYEEKLEGISVDISDSDDGSEEGSDFDPAGSDLD